MPLYDVKYQNYVIVFLSKGMRLYDFPESINMVHQLKNPYCREKEELYNYCLIMVIIMISSHQGRAILWYRYCFKKTDTPH